MEIYKTDIVLRISILLPMVLGLHDAVLGSPCNNQTVDIVFAIDSSSSIWKPDFQRQLTFIKDVAKQFELGNKPSQTRIGVVSFGDSFYVHFQLWQNNRQDLLERALLRIRHRATRKTNTGAALRYIRKYMFTHRYGSRKNVPHVVILITDGMSTDRKHMLSAAKKVKAKGILIFAIGVGDGVDYGELRATASKPSKHYVFQVDDYRSLDSLRYILANYTCKAGEIEEITSITTTTTTTRPLPPPDVILYPRIPDRVFPTPENVRLDGTASIGPGLLQADIDPSLNVTNCGGKPADIYFALDASNSIWPVDFEKQLKFIRDLISVFDISKSKTRVGLITFSDKARPIFDFSTRQDKEHLMKLVSNITFMSGRTKTSEALKFIREQGFSPTVARREVAHIVLIFTDGLSKNPRDTAREAELAKRDGIYLFSIGIGMAVERTELRDIASEPEDDFVFHVSNFSVLNTIKNILAIKTCSIQPNNFLSDQQHIGYGLPLYNMEAVQRYWKIGIGTLNQLDLNDCGMKSPIDLMFVYDSAQLGIQKTRKITKFVYDVSSAFDLTSGKLKIGRLMENCLSGADTYLTSQQPSLDFDEIHFPDMRRMIQKLARIGFSQHYGGRRDSKKVAVLFLDEDMENLKQSADEIARLKETHSVVLTIGTSELHTAAAFASRPLKDYLIHVPSYKYLTTAKYTLLEKLCNIFALEND